MVTRAEYKTLLKKMDHLTEEMEDIRQMLLKSRPQDEEQSEEAWGNLMSLSKEISAKWQGPSVVEEIRAQRNKGPER